MKALLSLLLFAPAFAASDPKPREYLWTMIACEESKEHFASEAFDAFLALTARRELQPEELRFPASFAVRLPDHIVLSRGFYVSQNELRGFEISIPRQCLREQDGIFRLTTPVIVEKVDRRQGLTLLYLKKKEPTPSPEPTR